ncbi:MAG: alcohol dehydrogenase catalytic domain-containing protein [Candidatus Poribacteria bacterium]|nr:alcohol dehydrogenase catalytic domain-containing protein [Candidatus Poribacteria bacterium]
MKAIVFETIQQLSIQEKPIPVLTDGDVLIQTELCGICASDLAALRGDVSDYAPPVVMGHELAGVIADSRHPDVKVGERVTVNPMLSCGACAECKNDLDKYCNTVEGIGHDIDGGYAEYMRMPKHGVDTGKLIRVPDSIPHEELLFLEPLGCCLNAMQETLFKDSVAILGAGPIGLMLTQLTKRAGLATYVVEPHTHRREVAETLGADHTFDTSAESVAHLQDLTNGGVDTVISATTNNASAIALAFEIVRRGGCLNFFGLAPEGEEFSINLEEFHYAGHKLMASWTFSRASLEESKQLLIEKALNFEPLLTDRFPMTDGLAAFDNAAAHTGIKTAVHP